MLRGSQEQSHYWHVLPGRGKCPAGLASQSPDGAEDNRTRSRQRFMGTKAHVPLRAAFTSCLCLLLLPSSLWGRRLPRVLDVSPRSPFPSFLSCVWGTLAALSHLSRSAWFSVVFEGCRANGKCCWPSIIFLISRALEQKAFSSGWQEKRM